MSGSSVSRLQTLSTLRQQQQRALAGSGADSRAATPLVGSPALPTVMSPLPPDAPPGQAPAVGPSVLLGAGGPRRATIHRRAPPLRPLVAKRINEVASPTAAAERGGDGDAAAASGSSAAGPSPPSAQAPASARSSSPPNSARGKAIGQNVVVSETLLGTGAFGAVYLGVDQRSGEMVAVKKVRLGAASEDARKQVELLVSEIKLMKQLDHPNIVRYLHAERQQDALCIYMEYMSGGTLTRMLRNFDGKLPPAMCRVYMRHALLGVEYLHRRNIVHRDIKPDNILLTTGGVAKLSDFGTSREFSDSANLLTVTGTPWFMAPEVVKGSGHGTAADIWSIGCTMVQLLTGKAPNEEYANPVTAMYQIATHPERVLEMVPADLPEDCRAAVAACLHEDPCQRATVQQLLAMPYFAAGAPPAAAAAPGDSAAAAAPAASADRPAGALERTSSGRRVSLPAEGMRAQAPTQGAQPVRGPSPPNAMPSGSGSGGAVPAVPVLNLGASQGTGGDRAGTPTVGTPRSFAQRLRDRTHEPPAE